MFGGSHNASYVFQQGDPKQSVARLTPLMPFWVAREVSHLFLLAMSEKKVHHLPLGHIQTLDVLP